MNRLRMDKKLKFLIFMHLPLFITGLILTIILLGYGRRLSDFKVELITIGIIHLLGQINVGAYAYINKKTIEQDSGSHEVAERKELAYNLTIYLAFLLVPVIYVYVAYKHSGASESTLKRAIKDYNTSRMNVVIEQDDVKKQIAKNQKVSKSIEDTKKLYNSHFINFEEYISYLWEVLEENNIKYTLTYDDDAIHAISEFIETY